MTDPSRPPETRAWQPSPPSSPPAPPPAPNPYQPPGGPQPGSYPLGSPPVGGYPPGPEQPWAAPGAPAPASSGRFAALRTKKTKIGAAGLAVIVAAVLLTGFVWPGFFRKSVLDVNSVQDGVRRILTDPATGYGATDVTDVRCNNGTNPTIKPDATFECDVTIAGKARKVQVTIADDQGSYWVGGPR